MQAERRLSEVSRRSEPHTGSSGPPTDASPPSLLSQELGQHPAHQQQPAGAAVHHTAQEQQGPPHGGPQPVGHGPGSHGPGSKPSRPRGGERERERRARKAAAATAAAAAGETHADGAPGIAGGHSDKPVPPKVLKRDGGPAPEGGAGHVVQHSKPAAQPQQPQHQAGHPPPQLQQQQQHAPQQRAEQLPQQGRGKPGALHVQPPQPQQSLQQLLPAAAPSPPPTAALQAPSQPQQQLPPPPQQQQQHRQALPTQDHRQQQPQQQRPGPPQQASGHAPQQQQHPLQQQQLIHQQYAVQVSSCGHSEIVSGLRLQRTTCT